MKNSEYLLDTSQILLLGKTPWLETFEETLTTDTDATVQTIETAPEALDLVRRHPIDCLITEYTLEETTGVELVTQLRETTMTLPVLLGTTAGSEAVASEAIKAGVSDYIKITEPLDPTIDELLERTEQALRSAQRTITHRERARQFDAVFHDTQTATWVLEPDGTLARANQTARKLPRPTALGQGPRLLRAGPPPRIG